MGNRITRSAKMRSCTLRLPCCNAESRTVVLAHAPSTGKGLAYKSPDWFAAYACSACHDVVDGRVVHNYPQSLILERWLAGIFETQEIMFNEGLLVVAQ